MNRVFTDGRIHIRISCFFMDHCLTLSFFNLMEQIKNFMEQVGNLMGHVRNLMGQVGNPLGQSGNPMGEDRTFMEPIFKIIDSDL